LAREYDAAFTHTPVAKALREIVWSHLDGVFSASQQVLELGCGTGEDALHLARAGIRVTATDSSNDMIEVARAKTGCFVAAEPVEFHCVPMERIVTAFSGRRFDGVFSNFGAINCVRDLGSFAADLASILAPGAALLWVLMGRRAPWEWIWYLPRGQVRRALRRFRRGGVPWRGMDISYPTPAEVAAALEPHFTVSHVRPLGCVLPPSYAAAWLNRSPRMLDTLKSLEQLAQRSPRLAAWSDHYIVEARRNPERRPASAIADGWERVA
jgi:SAM-dependent methyltransferase